MDWDMVFVFELATPAIHMLLPVIWLSLDSKYFSKKGLFNGYTTTQGVVWIDGMYSMI